MSQKGRKNVKQKISCKSNWSAQDIIERFKSEGKSASHCNWISWKVIETLRQIYWIWQISSKLNASTCSVVILEVVLYLVIYP